MLNRKSSLILVILLVVPAVYFSSGRFPLGRGKEAAGAEFLIRKLPSDTAAVALWDLTTPGYQAFSKSPWASRVDLAPLSTSNSAQPRAAKLIASLVGKNGSMEKLLQQGVLFLATSRWGVLFRSADATELRSFLERLPAELKAQQIPFESIESTSPGQATLKIAYSFSLKDFFEESASTAQIFQAIGEQRFTGQVYVTANDRIGVLSSDPAILQTIDKETEVVPAVLQSPSYHQLRSRQDVEQTIGFAFGETARMGLNDSTVANRFETASAVWSFSDSPRAEIRLECSKEAKDCIAEMGQGSSGAGALKLPQETIAMLSVDGFVISTLLQAVGIKLPAEPKRLTIGLRAAAFGILPIPDLILRLETADPESVRKELQRHIGSALAMLGTPGMSWIDRNISGKKAYSISTPLGLGVTTTALSDAVVVSNAELAIGDLIKIESDPSTPTLATNLPANAEELISKSASFFTYTVDFGKLARLLESLDHVMGMYAPADTGMMDSYVKQLAGYGREFAAARPEPGALTFTSFYQAPEPQPSKH
jgi:hypothetical protein